MPRLKNGMVISLWRGQSPCWFIESVMLFHVGNLALHSGRDNSSTRLNGYRPFGLLACGSGVGYCFDVSTGFMDCHARCYGIVAAIVLKSALIAWAERWRFTLMHCRFQ